MWGSHIYRYFNLMIHRCCFILLFFLPFLATACRDAKVAVYRIPKENDVPASDASSSPAPAGMSVPKDMAGTAVAKAEGAGLEWNAPAHWKSKAASAMRKASYTVGEEGGEAADFAITAFPGNVGGDLANVNRWRGQLQLPPLGETELASAMTRFEANGLKMVVVDLAGGTPDKPQRMLGAIVPYQGATWFFKLTGPDALVANEKPIYLKFLRTVKATAPAPITAVATPSMEVASPVADPMSAAVTKAGGADLRWTAPAHWQSKPPSAMRKATYMIPGDGGAATELSITAFPGAVGGELANVNRWRGQLQLPPLAETELAGAVSRTTVNGLQVTLVDLTGGTAENPRRMLGAIVPSNGANWFFKLTGPEALVAKEKPAFLAFVETLQAP